MFVRRGIFAALTILLPLSAPGQLSRDELLTFVDGAGEVKPVRTAEDWAVRRRAIVTAAQEIMGPLPRAAEPVPLDVQVSEEVDGGSYVRRLLTYQSEPGSRVPAYLLIPKRALAGGGPRVPAVLCLHPTDNAIGHKVVVG